MPAILSDARFTDEILETVLCEVESIINLRPLNKLNDSLDDLASFTPDDLLSFHGNVGGAPVKFIETDMLRKRWRHIQSMVFRQRRPPFRGAKYRNGPERRVRQIASCGFRLDPW